MAQPQIPAIPTPTAPPPGLPTGKSLAPVAEANEKDPNFAKTYPHLDRMQHILADGYYQLYYSNTPFEMLKLDLQRFSIDSSAFRSAEKSKLDRDLDYIKNMESTIEDLQVTVNTEFGKPSRVLTGLPQKRLDAQEVKLTLMKTRLHLFHQDYDIRKDIDGIDIAILQKTLQVIWFQLRIKENMIKGIDYDPGLDSHYMQLISYLSPLNEAKKPKYEQLARIREAQARLDNELYGHVARHLHLTAYQTGSSGGTIV